MNNKGSPKSLLEAIYNGVKETENSVYIDERIKSHVEDFIRNKISALAMSSKICSESDTAMKLLELLINDDL